MLAKRDENRIQSEIVCIEDLVPKTHLLRKIDAAVDFSKIYEIVKDLYCKDNGRPSTDPVVLFKTAIIQHLYGISSLRKTADEISLNVAYRWFLGYSLTERTPHFTTLSNNFCHRFTEETVERVFDWILGEINKAGYLAPEAVFIDGTHIKASANLKKAVKKAIPEAAKVYGEQLLEEINQDRENHDKKPFDDNKPPKEKIVNESTTDPECGVFHKGEHNKCFAYAAQTACDKNGYVLDVTLNPGNVHDSVAFDELYDRLCGKFPEMEYMAADAGYKTPWIAKRIIDDGRYPVLPYKRPNGKDSFFKPHEFFYDEYYDCVLCPENRVLKYATTTREGYRQFKSDPKICENCPSKYKCTESKNNVKTVEKHIWTDYMELVEDYRHTPPLRELYRHRKETIERVFADAKEKCAMRFTHLRGLTRNLGWVRLKFAAMNLKKYAIHKWHSRAYCVFFSFSRHFLVPALFNKNSNPDFAWKSGF